MTQRPKQQKRAKAKKAAEAIVREAKDLVSISGLWPVMIVVLILGVAFVLRSLALDLKPIHFDEGINGNFVRDVWRDGFYRYNPENFHGPLYFYFLLLAELFFGSTISAYRFVNGLISLVGLAVIVQHSRYLGRRATLWAAGVLALSAASVFYSRYAIHEWLFIVCQIVFSYGYFQWLETHSRRSLALISVGFFASIALKETFFVFFGTWAIAIFMSTWIGRFKGEPRKRREPLDEPVAGFWNQEANANECIIAASLGVWALLLIYSGFFLNQRGFHDMFAAYAFWTKTGAGHSGHEKPFTYWIELLWRYEWPGLIGLFCSAPLMWWGSYRERVVALVAFGTWLAYSLIPYKTPWLILNLLWPLALVFGLAIASLEDRFGKMAARGAMGLAILAIATTFWSSLKLNFKDFANEKESYVYVQSTEQMKFVTDLVFARVKARPEDLNMKVSVLVRDPWPLPWLFAEYPHLGYGKAADGDIQNADVILVDGDDQAVMEARLAAPYFRLPFKVRDSYEGGWAYLARERFKDLVPKDAAPVGPEAAAGEAL